MRYIDSLEAIGFEVVNVVERLYARVDAEAEQAS